MAGLLRKLCSTKLFPLFWTVLVIVLLCLPGSAFPDDGIFFGMEGFDHVDKFVHVIMFGGFVLFWSFNRQVHIRQPGQLMKAILAITGISIVLGVVMEYVQLYFIPNRNFDRYDIIADTAASLLVGLLFIFFGASGKR